MYNRMPHNMGRRFGFFSSNTMLNWLILILIVGVIIFAVYNIVQNNKDKSKAANHYQENNYRAKKNKALDILDERYAKGEIDEDEYLRRKSTLNE